MRNAERGASLISVVIGIGIFAMIAYFMAGAIANVIHTQQHLALKNDMLDLRRYVDTAFDCARSVTPRPAECSGAGDDQIFKAMDKRGDVLFEKYIGTDLTKYSKKGSYVIRARCVDCAGCANGKRVKVEATLVRNGKAAKDPLTGKPIEWADVYGGIPFACEVPP